VPAQKFRTYRNATLIIMEADGWDKFVNGGIAVTLVWFLRDAIMSISGG
jgi:hypothetical protein